MQLETAALTQRESTHTLLHNVQHYRVQPDVLLDLAITHVCKLNSEHSDPLLSF
jgi:hypothetical protein